ERRRRQVRDQVGRLRLQDGHVRGVVVEACDERGERVVQLVLRGRDDGHGGREGFVGVEGWRGLARLLLLLLLLLVMMMMLLREGVVRRGGARVSGWGESRSEGVRA